MPIEIKSNETEYIRKEWMHQEDMNLEKETNHVLHLKHLKAYENIFLKKPKVKQFWKDRLWFGLWQ